MIRKDERWKNCIALFVANIGNFKNLKFNASEEKTLVLSIICCKFKNEDEKIFEEEESIEILKLLGLIN